MVHRWYTEKPYAIENIMRRKRKFSSLFLCQNITRRRERRMFSDKILEKIFARKELQRLDLQTQSEVIHAIEEVLEEVKEDASSVSE